MLRGKLLWQRAVVNCRIVNPCDRMARTSPRTRNGRLPPPGQHGEQISHFLSCRHGYLDAADQFHHLAARRLAALLAAGDEIAVSDLTRLECRVQPIQQADQQRLTIFDQFFGVSRHPLFRRCADSSQAGQG